MDPKKKSKKSLLDRYSKGKKSVVGAVSPGISLAFNSNATHSTFKKRHESLQMPNLGSTVKPQNAFN